MYTHFPMLETAQTHALQHGLRERVVAYITRGDRTRPELLVFDHTPEFPTAGTQVPAGGLGAGESVIEGAMREAWEESGLEGLMSRGHLGSMLWENGVQRQVWHFCWLEVDATTRRGDRPVAPTAGLPDSWEYMAEGQYTFLLHFEPLESAVLHYDLDALLPQLWAALGYTVIEKAVCFVTRGSGELLVFEGYKDGEVHVPRGSLEPGETPAEAAKRELFEESSLTLGEPVSLGVSAFPLARAVRDKYPPDHPKQNQLWYYHHFHFTAPPSTPDAWTHEVSAGTSDSGRMYHFQFQSLETTNLPHDMDVGLQALKPRTGRTPLRPVVVCCITRDVNATRELLVFTGHRWGGVQVVAGGIDPGETSLQAAHREALEEAGLILPEGVFLGRHAWYHRSHSLEVYEDRYTFHFHIAEPRNQWDWVVSSGEADKGATFKHCFVPLEDARLDWDLDEFLPLLKLHHPRASNSL